MALNRLVEKLREGLINSRGFRSSLGPDDGDAVAADDWDKRTYAITPGDWQKCALATGHPVLREPDRRLPRFVDIEVDAIGIRRLFEPAPGEVSPSNSKGGRPPAVDWDLVKSEAFKLMHHHGDFSPSDQKWNAQARLEEKLEGFCRDKFKKVPALSGIQQRIPLWASRVEGRKTSLPRNLVVGRFWAFPGALAMPQAESRGRS